MRFGFAARLTALVLGLFLLVQLPTFFAFYYAIRHGVLTQAKARVESGTQVFKHILQARGHLLRNAVQVVTYDPAFREAVEKGDQQATRRLLLERGRQVDATLMVTLDRSGGVLAGTLADGHPLTAQDKAALRSHIRAHQTLWQMALSNGQLCQVLAVPLKDTLHVAWVVMGFRMETGLARRLGGFVGLDVTLLVRHPQGNWTVSSSSLPATARAALGHSLQHGTLPAGPRLSRYGRKEYLSAWTTLSRTHGTVLGAQLDYPLSRLLAPFRALEDTLMLIGVLSLLAILLGAMFLSRHVTRPMRSLARAARRIEDGDYDTEVQVRSNDEIGDLAAAFASMRRGLGRREAQIDYLAFHDGLTGLANRARLQQRLQQAMDAARTTGGALALIVVDIDRFKEINDTMGRSMGDRVLVEAGRRLQASVTRGMVARFGADEFVLLVDGLEHTANAEALAAMVYAAITSPLRVEDVDLQLDACLGVALFPFHADSAEELLRRADIAMYDAKQSPRPVRIYESGRDAQHLHRLGLIQDLRRAIHGRQLSLRYQPKIALRGERGLRLEALLHWQHPQYGAVPPDEFIPLAEQSGSIRMLDEWVMREVLGQVRDWRTGGLDVQVSLNLSAMDLSDGELPNRLAGMLREYGVPADRLQLEVTETALMRDAAHSIRVLEELKACGVGLSIDDFGTGYSSLSQLKRMPVDELKIDKSFVMNMARDSDDAVIVRSTIDLAHTMGLRVVAEGVEDAQILRMLEVSGCDQVQGFLISRPLPVGRATTWLRDHAGSRTPDGKGSTGARID